MACGQGFNTFKDFSRAFKFAVVQKCFPHIECIVFKVVACHTDLPDDLLLGSGQLGIGQFIVTQLFQFLVHQSDAMVHIFGVGSEIDAEYARVGIGSQVGLYMN